MLIFTPNSIILVCIVIMDFKTKIIITKSIGIYGKGVDDSTYTSLSLSVFLKASRPNMGSP